MVRRSNVHGAAIALRYSGATTWREPPSFDTPMASDPGFPAALRALLTVAGGLLGETAWGRLVLARGSDLLPPVAPPLPGGLTEPVEAAREAARRPVAPDAVRRTLRTAWGEDPLRVLDAFDPEPTAVTAAAQVHRARWEGRDVAIKVLRPGLAAAVRGDVRLLELLKGSLAGLTGRPEAAAALLGEVRAMATDELDLEVEGSTLRRARRLLRGVEGLVVAEPVLELTGEEVLVTRWLEGPTLAHERPADPVGTARVLVDAHVTAARGGLALMDARPGHVVLLRDGRVGLLGAGVARPVSGERGLPRAAAELVEPLLNPGRLDGDAVLAVAGAAARLPELVDPQDIALARGTVQLALLVGRLGARI